MAMFYCRRDFFIIVILGLVACWAIDDTENAADATCMLHKDLAVLKLHAKASSRTSNESDLNALDRDYIHDGEHVQSEPPKLPRDDIRLACGSFAVLAFLLAVPCTQKEPQNKMSWYICNQVLAAFSAPLIFRASKELLMHILALCGLEYMIGFNFLLFVIACVATYILLLMCESNKDEDQKYTSLFIAGLIGMYTASFAATDAFHMLTQMQMYVKSNIDYAFLFIWAVLAVVVINALANCVWRVIAYADQFAAVVIGYLICQAAETCIIRSQPAPTSALDPNELLAITVGFVVLALLAAAFSKAEPGPINLVFRSSCLMTAAWCAFDAITWEVTGGHIIQMRAIAPGTSTAAFFAAVILTLVVLVAFNVICLYSQVSYGSPWSDFQISNFRLLVGAMGFAIGIAWASCVIHAIAKHFFVINCLVLCTLILSIWIGCILPYAKLPKLSDENEPWK